MRISFGLPFIMLAMLSLPAAGQDIFKPLRDIVQDIVQPPVQTPRLTKPEAPPIPRQRPASLGGPEVPVVAEPIRPVVPQVARPVMPDPPAESPTPVPQLQSVDAPAPLVEPETVVTPDIEAMPEPVATDLPEPTPARIYQGACPALLQGQVEGKILPPIAEGQCGIQSPLEITAVLSRGHMVPFSAPVTTDCAMASALPGWVARVDGYAQSMLDSSLKQINTGPGYMCRNRNNAAAGLLSEHGFANALDISGFTLEDGTTVAVKTSWLPGNLPEGRLLRLAHDAACGSFTTVLGPEANAEHNDHIHLDLGCHGQSCTALLCE